MKHKVTFDPITQRPKPRGGKRDGAGRPKLMQNCVRVMVGMDRSDYDRILTVAKANGLTLQQAMRSAVSMWADMWDRPVPPKRGRLPKP